MREEAVEKERDEHFNTIRSVIPMKQEWRVKEKVDAPTLTTSDDDMDLLVNGEAPLIKNTSPPPTGMDINMVFTLSAEFRATKEEVAQMWIGPNKSSQQLKPLYVRGHIDGKLITRMLINDGAAINLISYAVFKNLGWEDDELMKTNLTFNSVGATRWRPEASSPWSSPWGTNRSLPRSSSSRCKVTIVLFLATIGFTPTAAFFLLCINS
jgi:hypothetical protein